LIENAMQNQINEELDLFLMANLTFKLTGLPFVVWISPRGNAKHDVRVKVSPGPRATSDMTTVGIRPEIRVIEGEMKAQDLVLLTQWIELNREVLIRYWDGDIAFTEDALAALRSI
jgi:hypothetical protein